MIFYRPQTKLRKGSVFTSVCQEFCPQGGGRCTAPWQTPPGQTPPGQTPRSDTPPQKSDGLCNGRYASYWNAFLLKLCSVSVQPSDLTDFFIHERISSFTCDNYGVPQLYVTEQTHALQVNSFRLLDFSFLGLQYLLH